MEHYKYFCNRECEYFPCHKIKEEEAFNCLFCYCPLYFLDGDCGGNYEILPSGVKSCMDCKLPHSPKAYDYIQNKLKEAIHNRANSYKSK